MIFKIPVTVQQRTQQSSRLSQPRRVALRFADQLQRPSSTVADRVRIEGSIGWLGELTATMTATTATNHDHRRTLATVHALVMPQDLAAGHT
jgi:hypothetical protein